MTNNDHQDGAPRPGANGDEGRVQRRDGAATAPSTTQHHQVTAQQRLPLDGLPWLDDYIGGLHAGSVVVLGGAPGARKSGLSAQLCLQLAAAGVPSVSLLTEETAERFRERAMRLTSDWPGEKARSAIALAHCDDGISDLEHLPKFLLREVLNPLGRFGGSKLVVLDSIQGHATPGAALKKYAKLFEFDQLARASGVTILQISQLTKANRLSGPRAVEHHCDCVLQLAKLGELRLLTCEKNRFAATQTAALPLIIDPISTSLRVAPHVTPVIGTARTYVSLAVGESEVQAQVSLPQNGVGPKITTPGLPRRRIDLILGAIAGLPMLDVGATCMSISALLPGDGTFRAWVSLPLAVSLVASFLRRPIPQQMLFVGEIDLHRAIRPLPDALVDALVTWLGDHDRERLTLIVPPTAVTRLKAAAGPAVRVIGCETLDQVVYTVWPDTH